MKHTYIVILLHTNSRSSNFDQLMSPKLAIATHVNIFNLKQYKLICLSQLPHFNVLSECRKSRRTPLFFCYILFQRYYAECLFPIEVLQSFSSPLFTLLHTCLRVCRILQLNIFPMHSTLTSIDHRLKFKVWASSQRTKLYFLC